MHGLAAQQVGQAIDAVRIRAPDVEHLATDVGSRRGHQRVDHIGHEREIARLCPVADNGQRLVVQLLSEKDAKDGAVGVRCTRARPIDVEQPQRYDRQLVHVRPMQGVLLADVLGQRVRILGPDGRRFRRRHQIRNAVT